jgi:hypothetical protein
MKSKGEEHEIATFQIFEEEPHVGQREEEQD